MTEVEKLLEYCRENNVIGLGVTTAYELGLSDHQPTAEEIAKALNDTHEWLKDPVNNLLSKIGGHLFLKKDSLMCLEHRTGLLEDGTWGKIPMTQEERWEVRHLKEDIELFEQAIKMIEDLRNEMQATHR